MTTESNKKNKVEDTPHVHGPNCNHSHDHQHEKLTPIRRNGDKVGRNDPCPCGSEKKFKKCCG